MENLIEGLKRSSEGGISVVNEVSPAAGICVVYSDELVQATSPDVNRNSTNLNSFFIGESISRRIRKSLVKPLH